MMLDRHFEEIKAVVIPHFPDFETDVVCVDIQNVYNTFYPEEAPAHFINVKSDLPNIASPWPLAWYEHHSIMPETKGTTGILIGCIGPNSGSRIVELLRQDFPGIDLSKMKWFIQYFLFMESRQLNRTAFVLSGHDALTDDGKSLLGDVFWYKPSDLFLAHPEMDSFVVNLYPALMAVSFLHCKNVSVHEGDPNTKINKKRAKKGKLPFFRFKILDIKPMKDTLQREGGLQQHGLRKALHTCRGHFKDYRNGRGLFGKIKGLFWWEMYERGDESEGIVHKDYRVDV